MYEDNKNTIEIFKDYSKTNVFLISVQPLKRLITLYLQRIKEQIMDNIGKDNFYQAQNIIKELVRSYKIIL